MDRNQNHPDPHNIENIEILEDGNPRIYEPVGNDAQRIVTSENHYTVKEVKQIVDQSVNLTSLHTSLTHDPKSSPSWNLQIHTPILESNPYLSISTDFTSYQKSLGGHLIISGYVKTPIHWNSDSTVHMVPQSKTQVGCMVQILKKFGTTNSNDKGSSNSISTKTHVNHENATENSVSHDDVVQQLALATQKIDESTAQIAMVNQNLKFLKLPMEKPVDSQFHENGHDSAHSINLTKLANVASFIDALFMQYLTEMVVGTVFLKIISFFLKYPTECGECQCITNHSELDLNLVQKVWKSIRLLPKTIFYSFYYLPLIVRRNYTGKPFSEIEAQVIHENSQQNLEKLSHMITDMSGIATNLCLVSICNFVVIQIFPIAGKNHFFITIFRFYCISLVLVSVQKRIPKISNPGT